MLIKSSQSDTLIKSSGSIGGVIGRSVAVVSVGYTNLNLFKAENVQVKMYVSKDGVTTDIFSNNVRALPIGSNCNDANLQFNAVNNVGLVEDSTHVVFNWTIDFPIGWVIPPGANVALEFSSTGSEWGTLTVPNDSWHEVDFYETSVVSARIPFIDTLNIKANETQCDYQAIGSVQKAVFVNLDKTSAAVTDNVVTSCNVSGTITNNLTTRGIMSNSGRYIDKDNIAYLLQSRVVFMEKYPVPSFNVSLGLQSANVNGGKNVLVIFGNR